MDTAVARRMCHMSSTIRTEPDWMEALKDAERCAVWATEAKAKELTDIEFRYVLNELAYYSSLHPPDGNARLSAADGVWFSDSLIDLEMTNELKNHAAILASAPDHQRDWYPDGESRMLNLIDPSLFPLIYSRSKLCRQSSMSVQASFKVEVPGEFPGSIDKWREALNGTDSSMPSYHIPPVQSCYDTCASRGFSRLPSEFHVSENGAVTIESYINNLHPVKHAPLYPIIASVFSKFVPLLEQVVTDLVHPRQLRVVPDRSKYYRSDEPLPECNDQLDREYLEWREHAAFVHPQPKPFVAPEHPISPYSLRGRRLQAIVRMSNIELTLENPIYAGVDWNLAGLANEHIIATGVFFYNVANIAESSLLFREAFSPWDFEAYNFDVDIISLVYGIDKEDFWNSESLLQEIGGVTIEDGRCLVFPSVLQHRMPALKQADANRPGHCKMLTFYFVDPSIRIPSTEIVPSQQKSWLLEELLTFEPFHSLPRLIVDGIMDKIDFPFSLKEAKKLRLKMVDIYESVFMDMSYTIFAPCYDNCC
ncbi:hypothetical protein GGI00_002151 [Coemansia sp. RSA 2681]|nr:hypothetical protein GGI00_002151 [Coemansia sp. RSA 2681]